MLHVTSGDPLSDYINGNFIDVSVHVHVFNSQSNTNCRGWGIEGHWSGGEGCERCVDV